MQPEVCRSPQTLPDQYDVRELCDYFLVQLRSRNNGYGIAQTMARYIYIFFLFLTQQPKSGLGRLIFEVPRSHTNRHTEAVRFP